LIQSTPSSTRRWSPGGRPPCDEGVVRKASTIAHSSSVVRPRITANLTGAERSAWDHSNPVQGNPPWQIRHKANPEPPVAIVFRTHRSAAGFYCCLSGPRRDGREVTRGQSRVCPQGLVTPGILVRFGATPSLGDLGLKVSLDRSRAPAAHGRISPYPQGAFPSSSVATLSFQHR